MNPPIQLEQTTPLFFNAILLACLWLSPCADAVSPAPDGGYPGGNTAEGEKALLNLTTGSFNTAIGWLSLETNTTGQFNTGVGAGTLASNIADKNTAVGTGALLSNTGGLENTATGAVALLANTSGADNTATGAFALEFNTMGTANTATGAGALEANTMGSFNTAMGLDALVANMGSFNTATGSEALLHNSTGDGNTAVGYKALTNNMAGGNTALGYNAGSALTTGDNNIDIGANVFGVAGEANTIRIGDTGITSTFIRGISGTIIPNGNPVNVDANGMLGTIVSSRRFKDQIKPMEKASEAVFLLEPVIFRYKKEIDPTGTQQFGLVAEQVEKVDPHLVVRDEKGKPYSVRYDAVNAMLLNEFLKEHKKVEQQQAVISQLESAVAKQEANAARQEKQIEALAAGLQRVSAQLELTGNAPQTASNL